MSNVEKIIDGQLVIWNKKKAAINKQKHGISFETAALIFADENRIERRDDKHSQELITARAATPNERSEYYGK